MGYYTFFYIDYAKALIDDFLPVDWSGRRSTPAGVRARGDPAGAKSAEEASPGTPAESERLERKSTA